MSDLFAEIKRQIGGHRPTIVLPEGTDERILKAANLLQNEQLVTPILIGDTDELEAKAKEIKVDLDGITIINPASYEHVDKMVSAFVERRKGKETEETAREKLLDVNYFGTMLVYMEKADGLVSGAAHSTGDTVRPALQIIKTQPGIKRTSGVFVMVKDEKKFVFGDCAINISPNKEELAEIAIATAETAKLFGLIRKWRCSAFRRKDRPPHKKLKKYLKPPSLPNKTARI